MVSVLEKLGVISICLLAIHLGRLMNDYWRKWCIIQYYKKIKLKDLGDWGVVVGADKNIGRAYAVELAKEGLNLVLVGTDSSKLKSLSNLLEKYFKVFSGRITLTFTANEFHYIDKALNYLDIAILINVPDCKDDVLLPEISQKIPGLDMALNTAINRNLLVLTKMCAMLMPGMIAKGKGIIVNPTFKKSKASSFLDKACTAYVEKLSEELQNKYSSSGVLVQTFFPMYVLSERPSARTKRLIAPTMVEPISSAPILTEFQRKILESPPFSLLYRNQAASVTKGILASVRRSVMFTTPL